MKNILFLFIISSLATMNATIHSESNNHMSTSIPFAQQYIDLINLLIKEGFNPNSIAVLKKLFAPNIKKIVNSKVVCADFDQVIGQMKSIEQTPGVNNMHVLELIEAKDSHINVLRFEIAYKDKTIESVITILKRNDNGQIEEINEVFGEKDVYQWAP